MSVLSIDIGTAHCTVMEGVAKKGSLEVQRVVTADLPRGDIADAKAVAPSTAADVIAGIIRGFDFKSKNAIITINLGNMHIRDFVLPNAKPKQLEGMVRFEMIQNYSAASTDIIKFTSRPLGDANTSKRKKDDALDKDNSTKTEIRAVALKRETIDSYYNVLKKLRLTPIAMDLHANAIEKLISGDISINRENMKNKAYMMVDFGSSGTLVHAVVDGKVFVSRHIPLGTNDLDNLISDREFIQTDLAKEFRLERLNLLAEEESPSSAMQVARTFFYQFSDELQKISRFFMARKGLSELKSLYLYGIGSQIRGLPEYLTASIGIDTSRLTDISKLTFRDRKGEAEISNCLNAAGAMIRLK